MNPSAPASQAAREACGRWFLANRSVEAAPNDPAALVGRAASLLAMDRPWEATNDLDRALRMQTRLAGADVAAAGDETTANQRRRRHDGEEARTRLLRGHAHAACLRYDRAVADFAEAEAILSRLGGSTDRSQPTPAHAQAGLGVAYCNMRDWQRCVDAGERAVRVTFDSARRHVARAVERRGAPVLGHGRRRRLAAVRRILGAAACTTTRRRRPHGGAAIPRHQHQHRRRRPRRALACVGAVVGVAPRPHVAGRRLARAPRRGVAEPRCGLRGPIPTEILTRRDRCGRSECGAPGRGRPGRRGARRGRRYPRGPCWTRRRPQCRRRCNSSSIASEKNDEPKAGEMPLSPSRKLSPRAGVKNA